MTSWVVGFLHMYVYMFLNMCVGTYAHKYMCFQRPEFNCEYVSQSLSTIYIEALSLIWTQGSQILLVYLARPLWGSFVTTPQALRL